MKQGATWKEYLEIHNSFLFSVSQTRLTTFVATKSLKDFPKHLPPNLRSPLQKDVVKMEREVGKLKEASGRRVTINTESDIFLDALFMVLASSKTGMRAKQVNFERLLHYQELVMVIAHVDAFMGDTLRIICRMRPKILGGDRKIDWSAIIASGGWSKLLERMTEQYVLEFGWKMIRSRVEFLRGGQLDLKLKYLKRDILYLLEEAEHTRNIIVHNGGKASQAYITKTRRNDLIVGDFVPIERQYLNAVHGAALLLVENIFTEVSKKFFGVENSASVSATYRKETNDKGNRAGSR